MTDKVCAPCNRRAGTEVDQPWQNWPLILELRNRYAVRDRDKNPPRPVRWTGDLTSGEGPAIVDIKGGEVNVRVLPTTHDEGAMQVYTGDPADLAKRKRRILRDAPQTRIVDLPAKTLEGPLQANVSWELNVHVWPRFAAKVALGTASLVADAAWVHSDEARALRHVLWHGHESTVETEMLPEGRAWSLAPFDLTGIEHWLQAPEHLISLERWENENWVSLVAFGSFHYGVPVSFELPRSDEPIAWLIDPLDRGHTPLTEGLLQAEQFRRSLHPYPSR